MVQEMTAPVVTADFYAIRIHIGEVLHLHIDRAKLLSIQSWCDHVASYSIEYTLDGGTMTTEYTERERWAAILKQLEEVL